MADHQHDHQHECHEHHGPITPEFWLKYWDSKEGRELNHQEVHECLLKYEDLALKGREKLKIFVPLCGKTYDIKWLADKGHEVVGIELSPVAVQQFFELNNIEFSVSKVPSIQGDLYTSKLGNIRIYCGDFFLFSKNLESNFQVVWDAGALHSFPKSEREKYIDVVKSLMAPGCQYLLEEDVPSCSDRFEIADLEKAFGPNFTVVDLGFTKTDVAMLKEWEIEGFRIFHIY
ncbi:thiopurine S-methyltransferase [Patella vulgata]|uniref:thiopurine S-methyltransferase n=1 Tax=Patella vulgata TaxID=6465 RepID=UPI00217F5BCA|nr:thiopurine S-methyltransferase [Patella vulgata]XP_050404587.1 thiopurine S-methyltransferase [Patella vulgata]